MSLVPSHKLFIPIKERRDFSISEKVAVKALVVSPFWVEYHIFFDP